MDEYPEDEYWEEGEEETTGCSIDHSPDEVCPECCNFGGNYAPGTEECEFCPWSDACSKIWEDDMLYADVAEALGGEHYHEYDF